ncbi:hypothetical protein ACTFIU_009054 [Dictyostelium citrinum]
MMEIIKINVVKATEANQQSKERKGKTAVSTTESAQVTEQFINDCPEASMMDAEWIFSKCNEFDVLSRLHYIVNNVFRRTGETRDPVLKVASLLSNVIQSKEISTWNKVIEMIISSIDTNKRREMVWKEFEKLKADGLKADGSNYEIGLTQQQFEESDENLWFTWIKDAIRTISSVTIKARTGSYVEFKLNSHQIIHLTNLDLEESVIPSIDSSTTTSTISTKIPITTTSTNNTSNIMDENKRTSTEAQKILNQFKDIFVEQIPKRPSFDMEVKVTAGSLPIKRSYNKMSQEESNKIETEVVKLSKPLWMNSKSSQGHTSTTLSSEEHMDHLGARKTKKRQGIP